MSAHKYYLGDSVYATFLHDDLILTTEDGISISNQIVLEPAVVELLLKVLESEKGEERVPNDLG